MGGGIIVILDSNKGVRMNEPCEEKYKKFFKDFIDFKNEAELHKKRGNNNFNPLLCVQKVDNEENMHSGMLYGLLNVRGEHYQDELFLDLFLEQVGLKGWFGNTKSASVKKEAKRIDIYISNGEKHIILENKIWAGDRQEQIARYIDSVHKNSNEDSNEGAIPYNNIAVIYLTPFSDRKPDSNSLKDWKIDNGFLVSGENKVVFKNISYDNEILEWIDKCKEKVGCIFSLNAGLEFYKDVVKIITNQKESKMDIKEFFNGENEKYIDYACEVLEAKDKIIEAKFEYIKKLIKQKYIESDCMVINYEDNTEMDFLSKEYTSYDVFEFCYSLNSRIFKKNITLSFFLRHEYNMSKNNKEELIEVLKEVVGNELSNKLTFCNKTINDKNYLLALGEEFALAKSAKEFTIEEAISFIDSHIGSINSLNEKIKADLDKGADSKLAKFGLNVYDEE